jgi:hypothetical protein
MKPWLCDGFEDSGECASSSSSDGSMRMALRSSTCLVLAPFLHISLNMT